MATWSVWSHHARVRGSIGVFYLLLREITADTPEQAEAKYRDAVETCSPIAVCPIVNIPEVPESPR